MDNSFKKQSKKLMIYNFLISIRELVLSYPVYKFLISLFGNRKIIILLLSIYIIIRLYHLISEYYSVQYCFNKDYFVIKKGLLSRNLLTFTSQNKNDAISNVREKSNIVQKILGVKELEIYLPNSENGIIRFSALPINEADTIQEWLKDTQNFSNSNNQVDKSNIHNVKLTTIIMTAFLSANYIAVIPILLDIENWMFKFHMNSYFISKNYGIYIVGIILTLIAFIAIVATQYFNFGKFHIDIKDNKIYVRNGFINQDRNLIDITSIKGVVKHSNFGMRLFGLETLSVLSINESQKDNGKSKNYILPYISKSITNSKINDLLGWDIPDYNFWPPRSKLSLFIGSIPKLLYVTILFGLLLVAFKYMHHSAYILVMLFLTISVYILRPMFTKFKYDTNFIYIKQGIFNTNTFIIPYSSIEHLSDIKSTILRYNSFHLFLETAPAKKFEIIGLSIPKNKCYSFLNIK